MKVKRLIKFFLSPDTLNVYNKKYKIILTVDIMCYSQEMGYQTHFSKSADR